MQRTKLNPFIIVTIITVAIVLALGLFLTLVFIQNRPSDSTTTVQVEGIDVRISMNPEDAVMIVENPGQGGVATAVPPSTQPAPVETPIPAPTNTPVPPTPLPQVDQIILVGHTVSSADTLFSISNQYNTTIPLMARFGVSSANLVPGNVISIAVANPAFCPGRRAYVIREGDTPLSISQMAGITLEEFRQINGLTESSPLQFTNVVCIP
jgi:LysM repeat protein